MTTADFKLACSNISFFTIGKFSDGSAYLDCPGSTACKTYIFNPKQRPDGDCYLQDRDKFTPNQLAKLQTNYPEMFV